MNNTNDFFISEVIKTVAGKNTRFHKYDREPATPLNIFRDFLYSKYNIEIELYFTRNPIPDFFVLSDINPICVVYDMTLIERTSSIRNLSFQTLTKGSLTTNLIRNLHLRLASDFLLLHGKVGLSFKLLSQALNSKIVTPYESQHIDLEMMDYDETYVVDWFFPMAHEIGHLLNDNNFDNQLINGLVTPENVQSVFLQLAESAYNAQIKYDDTIILHDDGRIEELNLTKTYHDYISSTDLINLREEIMADLIGIEIILNFAHGFIVKYAKKPYVDYFNLAQRLIETYLSFRFISSAKDLTNYLVQHENNVAYKSRSVTSNFGTRFCFAYNYLAKVLYYIKKNSIEFQKSNQETDLDDSFSDYTQYVDNHFSSIIHPAINEAHMIAINSLRTNLNSIMDELRKNKFMQGVAFNLDIDKFIHKCEHLNINDPFVEKIKQEFSR